uniref:Translocon-associated protein subunit beta n=1 Tax=Araucaria cunninghamii TaxID=56994 RepID=A0A0D6R852_ARACU
MEASKFLFAVFLIVVACRATFSFSAEIPFLLVHKKASLAKGKSDIERVAVTIDIYNQGSTTAYDVSLNDDSWPSDMFNLVSGNTSSTWDKFDVGASVSHSFVLESKVKGLFYGKPAVVRYRVAAKSALQEAYSTPIEPLDILAERLPENKYEWAKKLAAKYGPLTSVLSIMGLFVYIVVSPAKTSSKSSKKRR